RNITRSRAKPKPIIVARPRLIDNHNGAFQMSRAAATRMPAIITNSPWAKLTASVALYTSTKPSAISAYMSPMRMPLDIKSRKKPKSSDTSGGSLHVLDPDARLDGSLAAVLVRDRRGELDLVLAAVERADHPRILARHVEAPHF